MVGHLNSGDLESSTRRPQRLMGHILHSLMIIALEGIWVTHLPKDIPLTSGNISALYLSLG